MWLMRDYNNEYVVCDVYDRMEEEATSHATRLSHSSNVLLTPKGVQGQTQIKRYFSLQKCN